MNKANGSYTSKDSSIMSNLEKVKKTNINLKGQASTIIVSQK